MDRALFLPAAKPVTEVIEVVKRVNRRQTSRTGVEVLGFIEFTVSESPLALFINIEHIFFLPNYLMAFNYGVADLFCTHTVVETYVLNFV